MNERIEKWNERYGQREGLHNFAPSPPLPLAVEGLAPGLALDLAAGAGRHSLYLAGLGWRVEAVEGARVGAEILRTEARAGGLEGSIEVLVADLEARPPEFVVEPDRYDLVCDFYFLERRLFDAMRAGVKPGGRFAAAIHMEDPGAEREMNARFLLEPSELRSVVEGWGGEWEILHYHEGVPREGGHHRATAELVARRSSP